MLKPMNEKLKELKDTYDELKKALDKGQEKKELLLKLIEFLDEMIANPRLLDAEDKEFRTFVYGEFSSGTIKRLCKERSSDREVSPSISNSSLIPPFFQYLDTIALLLEKYLIVFTNEIETDNADMADSCRHLFDIDCLLHSFHFQDQKTEMEIVRCVANLLTEREKDRRGMAPKPHLGLARRRSEGRSYPGG